MFEKIARWISLYPRKTAFIFIILTCVLASQLVFLKADFTPQNMFNKKNAEYKFYSTFIKVFGADDSIILLMIKGEEIFSHRGAAFLNALSLAIEELENVKNTRSLCNIPEVRSIGEDEISVVPMLEIPLDKNTDFKKLKERAIQNRLYQRLYISTDGKTASVTTELTDNIQTIDQIKEVIEKIQEIISEFSIKYPEYEILLGGIPFIRVDIIRMLLKDQSLFIPLVGFVIAVIGYATFRYIQGIIFPAVTVLGILIWGMGVLHLAGGEINVLTNSIPVLIMIIGVADTIHLLVRYDEDINSGMDRRQAVQNSLKHIGAACFFTSFTTAMAFGSLGVSTNELLSRFGIYSSLAIIAAYCVTIICTPLLLLKWGRTEVIQTEENTHRRLEKILGMCADFCIQKRWLLFFTGILIVIFSVFGSFQTGMSNSLFEFYKKDSPVYRSNLEIEKSLSGVSPYTISFQGKPDLFKDPSFLHKIALLQKEIEKEPIVGKTLSVADLVKQVQTAFDEEKKNTAGIIATREEIEDYLFLVEEELSHLVTPDFSWGVIDVRCRARNSQIMSEHIQRVKQLIPNYFPENESKLKINVTGIGIFAYKSIDSLMRDMMKSIFMASFIVFIIIAIEFRSFQIALVSIMPNLIPVIFTFGMMGWLKIDLELSTVVVFSISLGLAVDDSIHFLTRFRDEFLKEENYEKAIKKTFNGAGRAIVYTTVILVLGLMVLTISSLPPMVKFAYLTGSTLISALLADLFILPASIMIFKPRIK